MKQASVLSIASEVYPLVKTGGLADVAGALPPALAEEGLIVSTLAPGYPALMRALEKPSAALEWPDLFGGPARIVAGRAAGLSLFALDAPHLFARDGGLYGDATGKDYPDNWRRFAALGRAGAELARGRAPGFSAEIVHAHDWQAAMAPVYLRYGDGAAPPSLMTIHNIAFQGRFDAAVFSQLGLPPRAYSIEGVEYFGGVGFLKGGMQSASAVSTVSPTYAKEIATASFGMGLEGLVNARRKDVFGILNGVDVGAWNPATDSHLQQTYDVRTIGRRVHNKRAIETALELDRDDGALFCVVSRLTWQKGVDLLVECVDAIVGAGGRLAVLGAGDAALEEALRAAAARAPGRIAARFGYDEALSHQLQGGADMILVPSRFEPCGLTQLYGLRYGCLPLVARTGGLADTVVDANDAAISAGAATGVVMRAIDAAGLREAIEKSMELYAQPALWRKMQRQAMKADVSWRGSAHRYAMLFENLIKRNAP